MFTRKLRLQSAHMLRVFQRFKSSEGQYDWGNYDASSGECCKMRDKEIAACSSGKSFCPWPEMENKCVGRSVTSNFWEKEYPKRLKEIYARSKGEQDCTLIKRDATLYKPSDKSRRYQRTWAECPLIWLRPKPYCCPDPEYYPTGKRRPHPPAETRLSPIEMHLYQMALLCKATLTEPGCRPGRTPPKCLIIRRPTNCKKKCSPMPSFSEACRHLMPKFCPTECSCSAPASMCEAWTAYHERGRTRKVCSRPLIGFTPFRPRMRFPW
ncbi:uncharacterized protein Dana_GF19808 [Drosophila ananassae]|uniref:Uncharacterized protein n=1 Tax=Drosophila ananassae TaxID=7217 RepID=B3MFZ8_DROAN|nr:uncharacterized protein LOC6502552 isoform X2 [Drosophila ananassae]EDV35680.1 uncharacterized protein Dana_GF19808 [Drosophila ananassae]